MAEKMQLLDYGGVQDTMCSGFARIERLNGDLFRFVTYVEEYPEAGRMQWVKTGSLLWPLCAIPAAIKQAADAITREAPLLFDERGKVLTVN